LEKGSEDENHGERGRAGIRCPLSLEALIESLKIADKVMAAAVNMEIVKKDQWHEHRLNDGDRVELLHFVGGG